MGLHVNLDPQPSNAELRRAFNRVRTAAAYGHAVAPLVATLNALRARRTTWFDRPELDLRAEIDAVLEAEQAVAP